LEDASNQRTRYFSEEKLLIEEGGKIMTKLPMSQRVAEKIVKKISLKKKLKPVCVYCGCTNKLLLTEDHILPKSRGGTDDDKNKQMACWTCNQLKGNLLDKEFRKYLKALYVLSDICKIKMIQQPVNLRFNQGYWPLGEGDLNEKRETI
jgi:hypothetical protein